VAVRKISDLVVVTGEYTDRNGDTKKKYQNVGVILEGEYGQFALIESTFNFAAMAETPGGTVKVQIYDANRDRGDRSEPAARAKGKSRAKMPEKFDEDLPF